MKKTIYLKVLFLVLALFLAGCTKSVVKPDTGANATDLVPGGNLPVSPEVPANGGASDVPSVIPGELPSRPVGPEPTEPAQPVEQPDPTPVAGPQSNAAYIPEGALAIYYTGSLSSSEDYYVFGIYDGPGTVYSDGTSEVFDIEVTHTNYGLLTYVPSLDKTYLLYSYDSPSHSPNNAYVQTIDDRIFVFREWGDYGDMDVQGITEFDPATGDMAQTTRLEQYSSRNIAIVGDTVYYVSPRAVNFYGQVTGGGKLYMQQLGSSQSTELLDRTDESNVGTYYGVGGRLLSAAYNNAESRLIVYEHSLSTGEITSTLQDLSTAAFYDDYGPTVYGGETALYLVGKASETSPIYHIYGLNLDGSSGLLLEIELEPGEDQLLVDEEDGKLIVTVVEGGFSSVITYDLTSEEVEQLDLKDNLGYRSGNEGNHYLFGK